MALPGFFGKHGEQGNLFQGKRDQMPKLVGWGGGGWTKTLRNRDHNKSFFRFLGNMGKSHFISGEQVNSYTLGGPQIYIHV